METEIYNSEGVVWKGKLKVIPRIGEEVLVNNKKHYGCYTVKTVAWKLDEDKVSIRVTES